MQASLARWAVVTFCTLGSVGCQGTKPGWWPGQKAPVYSQSSSTPPPGMQQQASQQQPGYMDQAGAGGYGQAAGTPGAPAYPAAAGGYAIGNGNPQDPYGMAGSPTTPGANPYDQAYAQQQQQQQQTGAYPEQYPNGAAPYGQPGAAQPGYVDAQAAGGYQQAQGYPQGGANPAYDPVRAADARYQAGAPAGGAPGYGTNSPYDAANASGGYPTQDPYSQPAPAGGYQPGAAPAEQPYQPGNTGYQPGNTGYAPAGVAPYQPPTGAYNAPSADAGAGQTDPHYRPGSTSDYSPAGASAATVAAAGSGQPAAANPAQAAAGYGTTARYPTTGATGNGGPAVDRYGRPIQESASGYSGDPNLQR